LIITKVIKKVTNTIDAEIIAMLTGSLQSWLPNVLSFSTRLIGYINDVVCYVTAFNCSVNKHIIDVPSTLPATEIEIDSGILVGGVILSAGHFLSTYDTCQLIKE